MMSVIFNQLYVCPNFQIDDDGFMTAILVTGSDYNEAVRLHEESKQNEQAS